MEAHMNEMISDTTARKIASEWYGGQSSELYSFVSTGAITWQCREEVGNLVYCNSDTENADEVRMLWAYIESKGNRGPQRGWGCLSW